MVVSLRRIAVKKTLAEDKGVSPCVLKRTCNGLEEKLVDYPNIDQAQRGRGTRPHANDYINVSRAVCLSAGRRSIFRCQFRGSGRQISSVGCVFGVARGFSFSFPSLTCNFMK